jgi:hypothetical protein
MNGANGVMLLLLVLQCQPSLPTKVGPRAVCSLDVPRPAEDFFVDNSPITRDVSILIMSIKFKVMTKR